jgi:hypothetical protein
LLCPRKESNSHEVAAGGFESLSRFEQKNGWNDLLMIATRYHGVNLTDGSEPMIFRQNFDE